MKAGSCFPQRMRVGGWYVRLVQRNADDWLGDLRTAMEQVEEVRAQGPDRG